MLCRGGSSRCIPCSCFLPTHPSGWGVSDASPGPPAPPQHRDGGTGQTKGPCLGLEQFQLGTCGRGAGGRRVGGRASKQQKAFQKSMPWTLPTSLVLEEPTHFSAVHTQHPAVGCSPVLPEFTAEVTPQKAQDGLKAPRCFPAELS